MGVCTNALCAVMGGDAVWDAVSEHLGIGNDGVTEDGSISLERIECNAACDYAPVVMVNWGVFRQPDPRPRPVDLVDKLRQGKPVGPTRGPKQVPTFKQNEHLLAGFEDGLVDEGINHAAHFAPLNETVDADADCSRQKGIHSRSR